MARMQVFVSHSHEDDAFCRAIVVGLRDAGADVWYDEHNMGSGRLGPTIERELRCRPVFVVVLSPDALASEWVEDEARWAYGLYRTDRSRVILPVTARAITEGDIWLFLQDFKRIEASGYQPYAAAEAVRRLLQTLDLTPADEAPTLFASEMHDSEDDLLEQGKAAIRRGQFANAALCFELATRLNSSSFLAWFNLGHSIRMSQGLNVEARTALERALALVPQGDLDWSDRARTLYEMEKFYEALDAIDCGLALDPKDASAWTIKGNILNRLYREDGALEAYDRAIAINPDSADAWYGKVGALGSKMGREWGRGPQETRRESLGACDRALALDPDNAYAWYSRGGLLMGMNRYDEALEAYNRALTLGLDDMTRVSVWHAKGEALEELKRYQEALAAFDFAFSPDASEDWETHARLYRALGRIADAEAAEARATELLEYEHSFDDYG